MKQASAMLFIVYLRFGAQKTKASELMSQHVAWLRHGLDDGVFFCAGSLPDGEGGALLAYGLTQEALERRLADDPFVAHNVVTVEIVPLNVGMMGKNAAFLAESVTMS